MEISNFPQPMNYIQRTENYKDSDRTGTVFPMENCRFSLINGIFSADDHYSTKSYPVQILIVCDSVQDHIETAKEQAPAASQAYLP